MRENDTGLAGSQRQTSVSTEGRAARATGRAGPESSCPRRRGLLRSQRPPGAEGSHLDGGPQAFAAERPGPGSCRGAHEAASPAAAPGEDVPLRATAGHSTGTAGWAQGLGCPAVSFISSLPLEEGTAPWPFSACLSKERGRRVSTGTSAGAGSGPRPQAGKHASQACRAAAATLSTRPSGSP